jgi:nicotinamide-nucleotide amidase
MRTFETLSIGSELLAGRTINSNVARISQALEALGWRCRQQTVVADDPVQLQQALEEALERSELVLSTGGLGPTVDDLTRPVMAELFGCEMAFNPTVAAQLEERFGQGHRILKDQATIPSAAIPFLNTVGTAPALLFEQGGRVLIALPGVPAELQVFLDKAVCPWLKERFPQSSVLCRRSLAFCCCRESEVDDWLRDLDAGQAELGIYPGIGTVSVQLTEEGPERAPLEAHLDTLAQQLAARAGARSYPTEAESLAHAVQKVMRERGLTLSTAESCTGGSIAALVTQHAGASEYFRGSVVSYSNEVKQDLLGVPPSILEEHGAVSLACVEQMARGVQALMGTDYALAVSGIAGPGGGSPEKPVGTICFALMTPEGELQSWQIQVLGKNRSRNIEWTVNEALGALWLRLQQGHG